LLAQPDLGYTSLLGVVTLILLLCAGTKLRYLLPMPLLGFAGLLTLAIAMPERRSRLLSFLDVEGTRLADGLQGWQSLIAFGSGGLSGLGLGNSRQKMFWLPEAHTDFIFPIVGEELGMWVALAVVLAFLLFVLSGGWISMHAPDTTGLLLGIGVTTLVGLQALMNFLVVTSMMPNKGLPLPFISYGGTNLLFCFASIGILFGLHRQGTYSPKRDKGLLPMRESLRM
jgi:cell division protein FtsW